MRCVPEASEAELGEYGRTERRGKGRDWAKVHMGCIGSLGRRQVP